jgi:hypothetical protein
MGAELRFGSPADAADLAAFLSRVARLDPAALVRLRGSGGATTAYVRLPFGVLVSRSARTQAAPADATVRAAALVAAVEAAGPEAVAVLPSRQDAGWRGELPPLTGWQQLDRVPTDVVARLVRAGAAALQALGPRGSAAGESLLDHEALTVAGAGRTVVLPLRVLSAVWRMGFLGAPGVGGEDTAGTARAGGDAAGTAGAAGGGDVSGSPSGGAARGAAEAHGVPGAAGPAAASVVISASGSWVRLAAPYGSAFHRATPSLLVLRR